MPLGANKVALYGASADTGTAVLLSTATASDDASISFTLPTAYKQVKFGFYNVTPATDNSNFQFDCSVSSSYGTTKTTTFFNAYQTEADTGAALSYDTGADLAQSTSYQSLAPNIGNGADESCAGELTLYNPSSTTYVKHFTARLQNYEKSNIAFDCYPAGYLNTTSALDGIRFQMHSGNIATGTIKMWGIK